MKRALLGWYACGFAAEPFLVSAVATYVPLFLEELARMNAVWIVDRRTPCLDVPTDIPGNVPVPLPPPQCVVRVLWTFIDTTTLPLYTFSVSVLAQTLLVISMSGIADRGAHRKRLLVTFSVLGALSVVSMYGINTTHYYVAALLAISANACFGAVSVCTNAYLPDLVAVAAEEEVLMRRTVFHRYYGASQAPTQVDAALVASRISGRGMAIGYSSALLVQILTMFLLLKFSKGTQSIYMLQLVIAIVGLWWLVFQIPVAIYLPSNSTPLAPDALSLSLDSQAPDECDDPWSTSQTSRLLKEIAYGWTSLAKTIPKAKQLRDVSIFLLGWFVVSDAITTINSTAILFARANLNMATAALAGVGLLAVCFGILGALGATYLKRLGPINGLIAVVLFASFIPFYGVLGFFTPYLGLREQWEMFLLAAWYGASLGAVNSLARSIFALLIPRGHETMFFALFSLTDKGSSVLGPAITGLITDRTHNIRYTFYFLLCMALLAACIFSFVNVSRGREDARCILEASASDQDNRSEND